MSCGYLTNNRYKFRPHDTNSIVPDKNPTVFEVNMRVEKKMNAYEESIEKKRDRLRDLFAIEEQKHIRETIDIAQKQKVDEMLQLNIRLAQINAKKEEDRLKLLEEKRLQQYMERCSELIPFVTKRHQKEATQGQLLQMAEKLTMKESEKELNHVWYDMLMREIQTADERERVEKILVKNKIREDCFFWNSQIEAHNATKLDELRKKKEEAIKMVNLKEKQEQDDLKALDAKRRARFKNMKDIMDQIRAKQEEIKRQEEKDKSFTKMQIELVKKANIFEDKRLEKQQRLRKEMQQYTEYYANLEAERKREQMIVDELVTTQVKEIQKKQDGAKCQLLRARQALQADVAQGRAEQLEYNKRKAEQELKLIQAENQLLEMARQQNERLRAEHERQQYLTNKQYGNDLLAQIDHQQKLKQIEHDAIERQIKLGLLQQEEYEAKLLERAKSEDSQQMVHPFRRVINLEKCPCPKTIYFS